MLKEHEMNHRQIIHLDIDAFFASVEQLDHPEYRHLPVIVGGDSDRSVVSTCSYEARQYGVKSAMSIVVAKKLCPHGIYVDGNMKRYVEISHSIFDKISQQFQITEQVSIDEAYIDVTNVEHVWKIAKSLKQSIYDDTGLTVSIGISYNKFLAKLASDWNKPNGIFQITHADIPHILFPLPIIKIHGLGKKTCVKLNQIGIFTVEDLFQYPSELLYPIIGESWANEIIERIHGIDHRPVGDASERKSYGREITLEADTDHRDVLYQQLLQYLYKIHASICKKELMTKTLTIKVKYFDFEQFTKSYSLEFHTNDLKILMNAFDALFNSIQFQKPVRLIGLTFSNLEDSKYKQFTLLETHYFE